MRKTIQELIRRRDLLYIITWREIKVRYKQSVMGFMWAIFLPAVIVAAGIIVRYGMSALSGKAVSAGAIAGVAVKSLAWAFFAGSMRFSSTSLIANSNLVTKIYMPRAFFPMAAILTQLFDFGIASFIVAVALLMTGSRMSWEALWAPILLAILVTLTIGWALILSAACLFFRDVKYLVEVVITFAVFITPVFYDVELFGTRAHLLLLNPLAPLMEGLERCIVYQGMPSLRWVSYSTTFAVVSLIGGFYLFKKWEPAFAEKI
jgi:ABC-type polysaccharide/polyol phosphate export permease